MYVRTYLLDYGYKQYVRIHHTFVSIVPVRVAVPVIVSTVVIPVRTHLAVSFAFLSLAYVRMYISIYLLCIRSPSSFRKTSDLALVIIFSKRLPISALMMRDSTSSNFK
jgi:hypothetical protein